MFMLPLCGSGRDRYRPTFSLRNSRLQSRSIAHPIHPYEVPLRKRRRNLPPSVNAAASLSSISRLVSRILYFPPASTTISGNFARLRPPNPVFLLILYLYDVALSHPQIPSGDSVPVLDGRQSSLESINGNLRSDSWRLPKSQRFPTLLALTGPPFLSANHQPIFI
ncbi:hypothetical protein BDQ12DRAFT_683048 [Crucibulum laeve]|uniref:Uncharacterized protein n=1 Tax=Crucibulum laeve TaxID=68775 RepID=A0A5C3M0S7_9AGAR|nr:hypothetical protein BDQ12DRAFT_683048 [Crucibulum laeve]